MNLFKFHSFLFCLFRSTIGCKIKALRAKTNTYIKTPVRGEEPVFVVTGRKEDVSKAKREILSAAEHFSLIRASRKPSLSGVSGKGTPAGPPANVPGQITIQVRVPYRVVGLVVGPKGATIKHIQQQTHTYIVTPSRDKEPVFEVTGMPDNVQSARRQIEAHIALRTGNAASALNGLNSGLLNELSNSNGGLSSLLNGEDTPEILATLYKNGLGSLFGYLDGNNQQELYNNVNACQNGMIGKNDMGVVNVLPSSAGSSTCSSNSSTSSQSSKSAIMTLPELINIWKRNDATPVDIDEGLGDSPQVCNAHTLTLTYTTSSTTSTIKFPKNQFQLNQTYLSNRIWNILFGACQNSIARKFRLKIRKTIHFYRIVNFTIEFSICMGILHLEFV